MAGLHTALTALLNLYGHQGDCPVSAGLDADRCDCWQSELGVDLRRLLAEYPPDGSEQYVITELRIDGLTATFADPNPERTPIGPFASREEAWEYAQAQQLRYGNGGGSVEVSPLVSPS